MTLVEVVAGLALLGSLLVGLLLARIAVSRQQTQADQRLEAVEGCDRLLSAWQASGQKVPHRSSGRTSDRANNDLRWSTRVLRTLTIETTAIEVVRLEITRGDKVLAHVDVLAD
jgi:type II secretory pathway pseudopilin PulG